MLCNIKTLYNRNSLLYRGFDYLKNMNYLCAWLVRHVRTPVRPRSGPPNVTYQLFYPVLKGVAGVLGLFGIDCMTVDLSKLSNNITLLPQEMRPAA